MNIFKHQKREAGSDDQALVFSKALLSVAIVIIMLQFFLLLLIAPLWSK